METRKGMKSFDEKMALYLENYDISLEKLEKEMIFIDDDQLSNMTMEDIKELTYCNTMVSLDTPFYIDYEDEDETILEYVHDIYSNDCVEKLTLAYNTIINSRIHNHILSLGYTSNALEIMTDYISSDGALSVVYKKAH